MVACYGLIVIERNETICTPTDGGNLTEWMKDWKTEWMNKRLITEKTE